LQAPYLSYTTILLSWDPAACSTWLCWQFGFFSKRSQKACWSSSNYWKMNPKSLLIKLQLFELQLFRWHSPGWLQLHAVKEVFCFRVYLEQRSNKNTECDRDGLRKVRQVFRLKSESKLIVRWAEIPIKCTAELRTRLATWVQNNLLGNISMNRLKNKLRGEWKKLSLNCKK